MFQNEECEHLGVFSEILNENNISYQYLKLYEEEEIPNLKDYSAIIILGGPMNVNEEEKYPFLKKENSVIKEALKIRKPMLGLCLGAQIIANAAGARVFPKKCSRYNQFHFCFFSSFFFFVLFFFSIISSPRTWFVFLF